MGRLLRPLRGRGSFFRIIRGCRFAQPPANGWQPYGLQYIGMRTLVYNDESSAWEFMYFKLLLGCFSESWSFKAAFTSRSLGTNTKTRLEYEV